MNILVPCSLLAENILSVFRSPHLPLDTPFWTRCFPFVMQYRKAGFPFATRSGSPVRIENDSDRKVKYFSKFFWKPPLSTFHGTLFIISRKYFSVFRSPHLPLDTPFWTRCFPFVMQYRKAGFPFATRARKREPCLQRYVSRMTRTENFRSQFLFQSFSGNHFCPRFMIPCSLLAENIFSVFRSPHLPLNTAFWTRGFSLVMQSRKAGFPFATRARKREPCPQISNR